MIRDSCSEHFGYSHPTSAVEESVVILLEMLFDAVWLQFQIRGMIIYYYRHCSNAHSPAFSCSG